jgi:hypothetical protein
MSKKKIRRIVINIALCAAIVLSFYLLSKDIREQKKILDIHQLRIESQMKLILEHNNKFRYLEKFLSGQV